MGKEIQKEEDFYRLKTSVGYSFQNPDEQLFSPSVEEELAFGPLNLDLPRDEVKKRIKKALSLLEIEHLKEKVTFKLSGGEKRLVSIACVLTMEPSALILD
jgi:cobalt/nickel transport system ATP-binding protein